MATGWIATDFGGLEVLQLTEVEVREPGPGEVTIEVRAAGMNPADYRHLSATRNTDRSKLPIHVGYEVAGVLSAIGPGTEIASGGGAVGDEVLAFRVRGGYATALTLWAKDVYAKPASLGFAEAANLLLAGTTAAQMLHVTRVATGETILLHAASGAVGVSALQQAALIGARVVGTASEHHFNVIRRYGGVPVAYGPGLVDRVRELAPEGIAAALDAAGTDEAIDTSLALVGDRSRIVTIVARARAQGDGFQALAGSMPGSIEYRNSVRSQLIDAAGEGRLVVPIAHTFPLDRAIEALELLQTGHAGGNLALIP